MRTLVFAALAAVPVALVGWVVWQGTHPPPPEKLVASTKAPGPAKAPAAQDPDAALLALFEGSPGGVKVKEKVALYDSKGLFDYIDGAAPIFIERGYRRLGAAEMAFEGSDLTCDVYDMVTPENATAIFNKEKPPTAKQVEGWPAAISGPMSFVFHAGRYYVKLTAFDAKAESALPALAKALREKAGTPPIAVVTPGTGAAPAAKPPDEDGALLALFDGPLGGAKVKEKAVLYDSKGLFDYIDGAAPVFIERGYRRLGAAELASPEGSDLVCDVYDMATADNAKAIFEKERSPSAKPVEGWPEAISGSMSFVFHAGRYYVKLTAFDAKAEAVLPALAGALKEKMR